MTFFSKFTRWVSGRQQDQGAIVRRYEAGKQSYGKKVRSDKRKARIRAELEAFGYRHFDLILEDKVSFKGYDVMWDTPHKGLTSVKPRFRYKLTKHVTKYGGYVYTDYK